MSNLLRPGSRHRKAGASRLLLPKVQRVTGSEKANIVLAAAFFAALTVIPGCAVRSDRSAGPYQDSPAAPVQAAVPVPAATPAPAAAKDEFRETIRPILSARCGKCHDPGGRMYARLPFDDPAVVASHSTGVLRRLKGEDRAAMEKWLAGLASAGAGR